MLCLPELSDRFLFQVAATRFYAGERVPFLTDSSSLRMQGALGRQFDNAFIRQPSVISSYSQLDLDYQRVFALYSEMREAKG